MDNLKEIFVEKCNIPAEYQINPFPFHQTNYLINGELREWKGEYNEVVSPIYVKEGNGYSRTIGSYPLMGEKEALEALEAAVCAYNHGNGEWPSMTVEQRIGCIRKFVMMMQEQREIIVNLLMWEIGKSRADSEKEFDRTLDYINDTIEALKQLDRTSSRFTISQHIIAQIRRAPLGVVLCMGPFNYPLNETFTTLIPALIMGNCVIFKPPKLGVLLHAPLLKAFQCAFPKGVVNTIYGEGEKVITPIMQSGKIDVFAFIGTSRVADILKKQHPHPHRMKSVLGLDAKNPAIILKDADLQNAVNECVLGALSFNGQRCTAIKIIFVHEDIAATFANMMAEAVEKLKIGLPWTKGVNLTPLPEENKADFLQNLIDDAVSKGAKLMNPNGGKSYFSLFFPAVLFNVNKEMMLWNKEQFGPVIPIATYKSIEEPLNYVVESNYGQQAAIFGKDSKELARLIDVLVNQVCRVNVNSQCQRGPDDFPFTGRKDSAEATLSVSDALRVFSIRTLVSTKENDTNISIIRQILKEDQSTFLNTDFIL